MNPELTVSLRIYCTAGLNIEFHFKKDAWIVCEPAVCPKLINMALMSVS